MAKIIRVTIEMNYDLDAFTDPDSDPQTPEHFIEESLEDYVYEDLSDLMRYNTLKSFSEIIVIDTVKESN